MNLIYNCQSYVSITLLWQKNYENDPDNNIHLYKHTYIYSFDLKETVRVILGDSTYAERATLDSQCS